MSTLSRPLAQPAFKSINPRPLLPLEEPPETLPLPSLPSPLRQPDFTDLYTLSTHIVPAAYPRAARDAPLPAPIPSHGLDKEERKKLVWQRTIEMVEAHTKFAGPGVGSRALLWNCVNRYLRKTNGGRKSKGLTLFFAHANGFPKEIWEPVLCHLLAGCSGVDIDEIWTWEAVQHGDSYLLNKGKLSGAFDWMDAGRDILNFLVNYLPATTTPSSLPTHLPRVSITESEARKVNGYTDRTLVVVGHSYGGCASASVAVHYPALFSSLVLVDPVIIQYVESAESRAKMHNYVRGALGRRDHWSLKDEALRLFRAIPFFAAWDPAMLEAYVEHGLTTDPTGGFTLKTPSVQEALIFASQSQFTSETWELLDRIDDRVELRWMMPGENSAQSKPIGDEEATRVKVWRRPANASNIQLPAGHLIPHERPREFALDLQAFLERKYGEKGARL